MSFSFNNERRPYLRAMIDTIRPIWAPVRRNLITIKSMAGAYHDDNEIDPIVINVKVKISKMSSDDSLESIKEDLSDWLVTDKVGELIFDISPNRIYYAMIDGGFENLQEYPDMFKGTINFICPDPYKYSFDPSNATFISDLIEIYNNGSVKTYPVFKANVKLPLTHLDIVSDQGYMRIGQPYEADDTPFEKETLILHDTMATLTGWGQATTVDNGYVTGTIESDGSSFYPATFGDVQEPKMFQGPSLKKSLSESIQDFRIDALVELKNLTGQTGILEIYLLDAANNVVGKVGLQDRYNVSSETIALARAGDNANGTFFANEKASKREMWQDYDGIVRIERVGDKWKAYFAVIKDGKHIYMRGSDDNLKYIDVDTKYTSLVSQVQVAFRVYPDTNAVPMKIKDIKVWRINQQQGVPYIAKVGDAIEIDHKNNNILINGESRIDLKDFGASYFPLNKGKNIIQYGPSVAADLTVEWRERFK